MLKVCRTPGLAACLKLLRLYEIVFLRYMLKNHLSDLIISYGNLPMHITSVQCMYVWSSGCACGTRDVGLKLST